MTLHIIKSARADTIEQVSKLITEGDEILLIEDGCYLYSAAKTLGSPTLSLSDHMQARGLSTKAYNAGIKLISFKQWALLTHHHPQSTSW